MEEMIQEREIHLSDYLVVLLKRKAVITAFFTITVSMTLLFSFLATPVFQSTARIVIDKESSSSPITGQRMDFENYQDHLMTFNTHFKLITSQPVMDQVIESLSLDRETNDLETSFFKKTVKQLKSNIKLLIKHEETESTPHEKYLSLLETVQGKITVSQERDTRLLAIQVKDTDAVLAADMANAVSEKYIQFNMANKMASSQQTLEWLNNELYSLRKKLEDAEKAFFEYKQDHKLFSVAGKQKVTEQKIMEFNNRYLESRNQRVELDAKINELTATRQGAGNLSNIRSLVDNPIIDTIYKKILELELELTGQSKIFKGGHPKILQLKSELEESRIRLNAEIQKELDNLKSERKVIAAREQTLEKTISEFESDALDASSKELAYTILQRNVATSQNLYDMMVSRVKESNILQTSDTSNIRVVEKAVVQVAPVSPNKKRNLLLGIVLGLFGGIGLAFFLEYLDQTLNTEDDIRNGFNLPVLSVIPLADQSHAAYGGKS